MISAGSDALWTRLRGALDLPDDERFRTNPDRVRNRAALSETIAAVLRTRTSADWEAALTEAGVPVSPVRDVAEVVAHAQTQALGILQQLGPGTTVAPPLSFDGERLRYRVAAAGTRRLTEPERPHREAGEERREPEPVRGEAEHARDRVRAPAALDDLLEPVVVRDVRNAVRE